jgi:hypothetical protein
MPRSVGGWWTDEWVGGPMDWWMDDRMNGWLERRTL